LPDEIIGPVNGINQPKPLMGAVKDGLRGNIFLSDNAILRKPTGEAIEQLLIESPIDAGDIVILPFFKHLKHLSSRLPSLLTTPE